MRATTATLALALTLAGCGDKASGDTADEELIGDPTNGFDLYNITCAPCHGVDGRVRDVKLPDVVPLSTDEELEEVILNGTEGMPPQDFTAAEVADLIAYLREKFPG